MHQRLNAAFQTRQMTHDAFTPGGVRLMAVRLSDAARLNEEGKPYDAELRRALQDVARRDPDADIRKDANAILKLEPYLGPG